MSDDEKPFGGLSAEELAEGADTASWLAEDYAAQGLHHLAGAYHAKAAQRRQAATQARTTQPQPRGTNHVR